MNSKWGVVLEGVIAILLAGALGVLVFITIGLHRWGKSGQRSRADPAGDV